MTDVLRARDPARARAGAPAPGRQPAGGAGARPRRGRRRGRARPRDGNQGRQRGRRQRGAGRAAVPRRRAPLVAAPRRSSTPPGSRSSSSSPFDTSSPAAAPRGAGRLPHCGGDAAPSACCASRSRSSRPAPHPRRPARASSTRSAVPVLVVQGENDRFGMPAAGDSREVVTVAGDHGLKKDRERIADGRRASGSTACSRVTPSAATRARAASAAPAPARRRRPRCRARRG